MLGERPFLKDSTCYPVDRTNIVVLPQSLLLQWEQEAQVFFPRDKFGIFRYPASEDERKGFWEKNSPWSTSPLPKSHRIILTTQSVSTMRTSAHSPPCSHHVPDLPLSSPSRATLSIFILGCEPKELFHGIAPLLTSTTAAGSPRLSTRCLTCASS